MTRLMDVLFSMIGLILTVPVIVVCGFCIWMQDWGNPFYVSMRTGRNGKPFRIFKLRSMTMGADQGGNTAVSGTNSQVTKVGKVMRHLKIDELPQLINVLLGDMRMVGLRPELPELVSRYTENELRLLSQPPGLTGLASIVLIDQGMILSLYPDANAAYDELIRPLKYRLNLYYFSNRSLWMDFQLIYFTVVALVSHPLGLQKVARMLTKNGASPEMVRLVTRKYKMGTLSFGNDGLYR